MHLLCKAYLLPKGLELLAVSLLALAFLLFAALPDGVEEHDLVFLEGAELVRQFGLLFPFLLFGCLMFVSGV
jgi:hypothetical protein